MKRKLPIRQIKTLPDIFNWIEYPEMAKAIGISPETLKKYVTEKPEWFSLEQCYKMADYIGVDGWKVLKLVHEWAVERGGRIDNS